MFTRKQLHIGVYGGIGGILPNLLDFANQLFNRDLGKWFDSTDSVFWAILGPAGAYLIWFFIGGVIAMAFEETKPLKAIVLGISAPALIAAWLSGNAPRDEVVRLDGLLGIKTAYAEEVPPDNLLNIMLVFPDHPKVKQGLKYKSFDMVGKEVGFGKIEGPGSMQLSVPKNGSMVIYGDAINPRVLAKLQADKTYNVNLKRNYWNDFYRAMGVRYKEPYDLTVQLMKNGS